MGFIGTLEKIDRRHLIIVTLITIVLPLLFPSVFRQPIVVTDMTQDFYDYLLTVESGDVVMCSSTMTAAVSWPECGYTVIEVYKWLLERGAKIIIASAIPTTPLLLDSLVIPSLADAGGVYGENYVNLGYVPGGTAGYGVKFAIDPRTALSTDYFGTPLEDIPLMQEIFQQMEDEGKRFMEIPKIICHTGIMYTEIFMWVMPYRKTAIALFTTMLAMLHQPHYEAGIVDGCLYGPRGGAELESILLEEAGPTTALVSALSLQHTSLFIFWIIGNLIFWSKRLKGGK